MTKFHEHTFITLVNNRILGSTRYGYCNVYNWFLPMPTKPTDRIFFSMKYNGYLVHFR